MAVLDTLEILIEADSSGLQTQLKKATDTVIGFVDKMNDQTVNWQSILSGALDTSIISGIASTFALAIEQTVSFQNAALNLNNIATPATASLADSINQVGGQAYQLAQSSGQSLGDATSAFEAFSKAGLDSAAATTAVNEASQIAYATGESYTDVVTELVALFQQWGVTTTPQVTQALTGLANAAQTGQFSFDELIQALTPQGAILQTKTNISDTAISLAELSDQTGLTKTSVLDTFSAIAAGVQNPISSINLLVGNMATAVSSGPTGLITAFQNIKTKLDEYGPEIATTIGSSIGLAQNDVASFSNTSQAAFTATGNAALALDKNLIPLDQITSDNTTDVGKLKIAWNDFITTVSQFVLPPALKLLTETLDDMTTSINLIAGFFSKAPALIGGVTSSQTGNVANSTPSGGLPLNYLNGSPSSLSPSSSTGLDQLGTTIGTAILSFLSKNSNNSNTTTGNASSSTVLNITNNVSGAGKNGPAIGQNIATQLYNLSQGAQ